MTDQTSPDSSPLGVEAEQKHNTVSAGLATTRTALPANSIEPNTTNNVTSSNTTSSSAKWPNERLPAQQQPHTPPLLQTQPRGVHVPRSTGTFSSGTHSLSTSRSPSTAASPHSSRDSSPAGRVFRQQSIPGAASLTSQSGMRSRKDSHDVSPHRPPSITGYTSSVPSAAAIQRALSATTTPQLQPAPTSEPASKIARPAKGTTASTPSEGNTPSWPVSPRLKSPPPSRSRRNSLRTQKRSDTLPPSITVQTATPTTSTDALPYIDNELESEPRHIVQKPSNRGVSEAPTLETVQETSGPNTPGNDLNSLASNNPERKYFDMSEEDRKVPSGSTTPRRSMADAVGKAKANNSDSDTAPKKEESKKEQENDHEKTPRPKAPSTRTSFSSLRQKTGAESATQNMTVETETVNSVAQSAIGPPSDRVSSRAEHGGTLRTKASNDTIKPSKGRKKASRKAPSINATSGSTRADIFEDRVKNAMDEATSDDSDETFVYESNPAEPPIRRSRHHSRTPSGTSLTSMGGTRDGRQNQGTGVLGTQKTRSMKFANAYNSADDDGVERTDGTIRASNGRGGGSQVHHHHTGRPSRSTTGHASILDDDSPFPQLNKVRSLTGLPGRQTQNARIAARNLQASNGNGNGIRSARKDHAYMSYDLDAEGGDDERTPLIANTVTARTPRVLRRPPTRGSRPGAYPRRRQGMLTRFAGCIAIIAMLFLLVFGIVGFLFIITTPLSHVEVYGIQSVIASETEIMFDMKVGAINPNLVPISVEDVDFIVFAKSKYVGTEKWWRDHPDGEWAEGPLPPKRELHVEESGRKLSTTVIDAEENFLPSIPGSWPDDDLDGDPDTKKTMLLGHVFHFDNPLTFEPSFLKRHVHNSTGAIRINHPGNHTELGGTERWERVVLHEFDLIVRGTMKYTIPLGGKSFTVNIGARVTVDPQKDEGPGPGEGEGPKNGNDEKNKDLETVQVSQMGTRLSFTVHPLEEGPAHERLKRRVWARILRAL